MAEIEHIDDEADGAGINFVKIDDKVMAKEFGVFALPAILFFRQNSKEPVIYAGWFCHLIRLNNDTFYCNAILFASSKQEICMKKIKFSIGWWHKKIPAVMSSKISRVNDSSI